MMERSPFVAPVHRVNPLDINKSERKGATERMARAFPINPDPSIINIKKDSHGGGIPAFGAAPTPTRRIR